MALVAREASGFDFLEALDDAGSVVVWRHRRHFGLYCRQVEGGASATLRDAEGRLVCIVGLYASPFDPPRQAEAWFAAGPALRPNLLAAVRGLRRLLERVGAEVAPMRIRAFVDRDGVAGARLAGWLGFADDGPATVGPPTNRQFVRTF